MDQLALIRITYSYKLSNGAVTVKGMNLPVRHTGLSCISAVLALLGRGYTLFTNFAEQLLACDTNITHLGDVPARIL